MGHRAWSVLESAKISHRLQESNLGLLQSCKTCVFIKASRGNSPYRAAAASRNDAWVWVALAEQMPGCLRLVDAVLEGHSGACRLEHSFR